MNNIQKAFAAKKKIGIRMADGGSVLRMSTELTPQAPSTRPVRSLRDGFNAIVDRIQERGPSLAGAAAPFAKARDDIAAHTSERGYPGQPMQAPMVATNAPAQRFADGGRADMRSGGDVRGPGGPREDKVKAWLSPGEFVVNAKAVEKFGAENLEEINEEGLPDGENTPHERSEGNEEGIRAAKGFSPMVDRPFTDYEGPRARPPVAQPAPRAELRARTPDVSRATRVAAGPQNPFQAPPQAVPQAAPQSAPQSAPQAKSTVGRMREWAASKIGTAPGTAPAVGRGFSYGAGKMLGQGVRGLAKANAYAAPLLGAYDSTQTSDDEYKSRTGIDNNVGARVVGTLGDIGDRASFGLATKAGNYLAGNGFRGRDDPTPTTTPSTPTTGQPSAAMPTMRTPDPAAISPTPFEARNSMRGGLPVADQRGATPSDGLAAANKDMNSFNGPRLRDPTYKLGGYDTNADIYAQATNGGKKLNSFTGTGDGSAAAEYEKSDQYQSGIRRAAADKAMLNEMVARREAGGGQGGGGVSMLGGQSVFSPIADPSKMTRGDKGREIQREQIAAQTAHQNGIRSDSIANQAANLAEQKRAHNMQGEASMRSNQIAGAKLLMDERKYGADRSDVLETQRGKAKEGRIDSDKAYRDQLKTQHPDVDGVQSPLIAQKMVAMNQAISSRVAQLRKAGRNDDAAALEINGASEVGADESARIDQGVEVMNRFNELQPRWFGASDGETSSNYLDFLPHPSSKGDTVNLGQPDAKGKFARTIPRKHLSRTMIQNYNPFADQGIPTADYLRGQ